MSNQTPNRTPSARGTRTLSRFPRRDALVRFFRVDAPRPLALSDVAPLLGTTPAIVRAIDDHVADLLHSAISLDTLEALRTDAQFLQACHFPFDE